MTKRRQMATKVAVLAGTGERGDARKVAHGFSAP